LTFSEFNYDYHYDYDDGGLNLYTISDVDNSEVTSDVSNNINIHCIWTIENNVFTMHFK